MRFLKRLVLFVSMAVLCVVMPASVYASAGEPSSSDMYFYGLNNILFFSPGKETCYGTMTGSTVYEKMLSYLLSVGLNETAVAGIYGNLVVEGFGGGELLSHEDGVDSRDDIGSTYGDSVVQENDVLNLDDPNVMHGLGIAQWSFGERVLFLNKLADEGGLDIYARDWDDSRGVYTYDGMSYDEMKEKLGQDVTDRIFLVEMEFFFDLFLKNDYKNEGYNFVVTNDDIAAQGLSRYGITAGMTLVKALNLVSTPGEAAELFFSTVEMPSFSGFSEGQTIRATKANEGLDLIRSAGLTSNGATVCGGNNDIVETALQLAWNIETEGQHAKDDPRPEYITAMKSVGTWYEPGPCGESGCAPNGASCDIFVSTVLIYSGVDKEFPPFGPKNQRNHMRDRSDMYVEIDNLGDASNLEAGDIFVIADRHIFIYMGIEDGKWMQASASFNGRTAEYFSYEEYSQNGVPYQIFRRI